MTSVLRNFDVYFDASVITQVFPYCRNFETCIYIHLPAEVEHSRCLNEQIMGDNDQSTYSFDKHQIRIDYTTLTPRFSVTNNDSLNDGITHLNEHGYAIFSDVMHEEEINVNKELLWRFLENIPGYRIQRHDPRTWSKNW